MIRIGTVELGKKPVVVLSIDGGEEDKLDYARRLGVNLIEVRGDLVISKGVDLSGLNRVLDLIGDYGFYSVLTLRPEWEGGKLNCSEEERLQLFEKLVKHPSVGAVDVELRASILSDVRELAKREGKVLIVSYHDFEKTPPAEEIGGIFRRAVEAGADIVKLAFYGNSLSDVSRVCCVMNSIDYPKVFMVMGAVGKMTRVVGFHFGSLMTYTFLGKSVAPGQIPLEELKNLLEKFYNC
ncbi:3-dehydroquinate dehydratase [Desulfurobacterium pacificum]|uniref:3-dehydroquinate dehydratase n=1 Tax=Desulfurobacterium pacificum TaxID=240166 RepID=A0ABY1NVY5_9BACT|nr:type I 3-dehydroquinate dehydratase [Desulfurobacterium pacificum]SMP19044.1 3-dehydroquinate dehydratase [Desulfurobacterium pacificum]